MLQKTFVPLDGAISVYSLEVEVVGIEHGLALRLLVRGADEVQLCPRKARRQRIEGSAGDSSDAGSSEEDAGSACGSDASSFQSQQETDLKLRKWLSLFFFKSLSSKNQRTWKKKLKCPCQGVALVLLLSIGMVTFLWRIIAWATATM